MKGCAVVEEGFICKEETHLTVLKTSLFFAGDGFTVYDCKGQLVFRVDTYGPDSDKSELVLMDPFGKCLLTVRRKVSLCFHVYLSYSATITVFIHRRVNSAGSVFFGSRLASGSGIT